MNLQLLHKMLVLSLGLLLCPNSLIAMDNLYVFMPSDIRTTVIQEQISRSCNQIDVTVFGRSKDFHKQIHLSPPSALLSLRTVIENQPNYSLIIQGYRHKRPDEAFILVSVEKAVDLTSLSGKKVGAIDLLGRKAMNTFLNETIGHDIKLKRVTKQEDLLPLLRFGAVSAIFTSESRFQYLQKRSQLNLISVDLNIRLGLASVGLLKHNSSHNQTQVIQNCILNMNNEINHKIGVEEWKAL